MTVVRLALFTVGFGCLASMFARPEEQEGPKRYDWDDPPIGMPIALEGEAKGGDLVLTDVYGGYTRILTEPGESSISTARRLAEHIVGTLAFQGIEGYVNAQPGFSVDAGGGRLDYPCIGRMAFAGTEMGLGIPRAPQSVTWSYKDNDRVVSVSWAHCKYDCTRMLVICCAGGSWEVTRDCHEMAFEKEITGADKGFQVHPHIPGFSDAPSWQLYRDGPSWRVVCVRGDTPSNYAGTWMYGPYQEERFDIPYSSNVRPNWAVWNVQGHAAVSPIEARRPGFDPKRTLIGDIDPEKREFYQKLESGAPEAVGGIYRQFLGLLSERRYRIYVRMNTLDASGGGGEETWRYSFHAACNTPGAPPDEFTGEQLAGLAPLPDGTQGGAAGRVAIYTSEATTEGKWAKRQTGDGGVGCEIGDITTPPGCDAITVWLRLEGGPCPGVGMDYICLEDLDFEIPSVVVSGKDDKLSGE